MRRAILVLIGSLVLLAAAGAWRADPPAGTAPVKSGGPGQPLSPQEAARHFRLPAGLRIELVAAEPTVQSPVAIAFDPRGRLWVVEMRDYPNGPAKGKPPEGRIRILIDRNRDGIYESGSTFAEGLLFANGLLLWKDGAIVTAAPHVAHLRDTDGDGLADKTEVLYKGFAAKNPQLRVSHPVLGLDGWVYLANGLRGGKVRRAGSAAAPIDLSGRDFRFDPLNLRGEAISGMGQFGNAFDAWGRRFVCDNRHHLRHVVLEDRYVKRNPYLAVPAPVEDVSVLPDGPLSSGGKVYPLSRNWTTSSLHEGRFTAACGVHVFESALLGKEYQGVAFTCEPTGNLVHGERLTPKGATFEGRPLKKGVEFLATTDDWFRPVSLTTGPDGALYVVDMYRAVIEHPEFMPPELKNRPDLLRGKDRGRIWRIVPEGVGRMPATAALDRVRTAELVAALADVQPWRRTTAHRLLLERQDRTAIEPLRKLYDTAQDPHARLLAAWSLERFGALETERLAGMLGDPHPRLREHALLLSEPRLAASQTLQAKALALAADADGRVRFQAALTLGELKDERVLAALVKIARAGADDRWTRYAIASAVPTRAGALLTALLPTLTQPRPSELQLVQELAALVGARRDKSEMDHVVTALSTPSGKVGADVQLAGLNGLADGVGRRGGTLGRTLEGDSARWFERFVQEQAAKAADRMLPGARRIAIVRLIAQGPWAPAKKVLPPLIADEPDQAVRLAALRALAARGEKEVPALLMAAWRGATPAVRREIVEAMFRSPERLALLLGEVEAHRVRAAELDPVRTRQLLKHPRAELRDRARKLFRDASPQERQAVLKRYRAALALKGDPTKGREVFRKNCATCHRVGGIGVDVGPDIADTRTKTLEALLTDIVLPNQAIDNNYVNYVVTTKAGRVFSGLLVAESASSVTLKRAEGQADVILRQDVEEISSTGVSLMPEGLEKNISLREMADLLSFLKNWRYLDGSVPLGK